MELFYPALLRIQPAAVDHDEGGEFLLLLRGDLLIEAGLVINTGRFRFRAEGAGGLRQTVVAETAADGMEGIVALFQRGDQALEGANIGIGRGGKFFDVDIEERCLVNLKQIVRAECWQDPGADVGGGDGFVMCQGIGGIVCGADHLHLKICQDSAGAPVRIGEAGVGLLPDAGRGFRGQQFIDAEITLQFNMAPVEERVPQAIRNGAGQREELFVGLGISRAVFFGFAIGTHRPPFVVVARQPNIEEIAKPAVPSHVLRRKVRVIVDDWLWRGGFVVEAAGQRCGKQEVVVNEAHGEQGEFEVFSLCLTVG